MKRGQVAIVLNDAAEELIKSCEGDPATWRPDGPQDRAITKAWAMLQSVRRVLAGPELADNCEQHEWYRAGQLEDGILKGNYLQFTTRLWNGEHYQGRAFPPKCWVPLAAATREGHPRGWSMRAVLDFLGEQAEEYGPGAVPAEMAEVDGRNRAKAERFYRRGITG